MAKEESLLRASSECCGSKEGTAKGRTGGLSASTKREQIRDYMYRQIDQGAR